MTQQIDLSGLKDLHVLQEPSLWPLAAGWWLVIGVFLTLCILTLICYQLWRNKPSVYAIRKVRKMENIQDDLSYLKHISQLLRRVAIAVFGRPKIAPLSDQTWQDFLLNTAPDTLTAKEAHLIAFAPYESKIKGTLDRTQLTQHLTLWINKVFENKKSS